MSALTLYTPLSSSIWTDGSLHQAMVAAANTSMYSWVPANAIYGSALTWDLPSFHLQERQAALNTVQSMTELPENWDGYGAASIPPDIAGAAATIISSLALHIPAPEVSANPNGTISLEWENERGRAHLEIGRTTYSAYFRRPGGIPLYRDGSVNELHQSKENLLGAMYSLAPAQGYTISDLRLEQTA